MNNPKGSRILSQMPLLLASLLCIPLAACQGKDPPPKSGAADRPLSLPRERKPVNATAARPATRPTGPVSPYRSWQPEALPDAAPPAYFDQFRAGTYRAYEPLARSGPIQYQGYRFRPTEPGQTGRPATGTPYGDWGMGGGDPGGYERGSGYGSGYAQRGPRFRPPEERERERPQRDSWSPYGWPPYGPGGYPPFLERDAYGFEPGGW